MNLPAASYLVDSSVLVACLRGSRTVTLRLDDLPNKHTSPTVIAELAFGAHRSHNPQVAFADLDQLIGALPILQIDKSIAYDFAETKHKLVRTNQLIPDNDIWIAVTAMAYGMTLVSRDAHFNRIVPYGLVHQQW
jgi:tRNA(fMet)-specific endonuclease VapC